jgi:hypothetical protein
MAPRAEKLLEIHSPEAATPKIPEFSWTFDGAAQSHFFPFQYFRDQFDPWRALQ